MLADTIRNPQPHPNPPALPPASGQWLPPSRAQGSVGAPMFLRGGPCRRACPHVHCPQPDTRTTPRNPLRRCRCDLAASEHVPRQVFDLGVFISQPRGCVQAVGDLGLSQVRQCRAGRSASGRTASHSRIRRPPSLRSLSAITRMKAAGPCCRS
jgi:hypothetical protein